MDDYKAARILAYAEVLKENQTEAYGIRHVQRWFSEKFSTSFPEVERMPIDDLLMHYYEVEAEAAVSATSADGQEGFQARQALAATLRKLSMTADEIAARAAALVKKDDDFDAEVAAEAAAQEAAEKQAPQAPPPKDPDEPLPIKMEFGSPGELEELGEGDGFGGLVGFDKP